MTAEDRRLMKECPAVVGIITSVLGSGGSLDAAARSIAAGGPPMSSAMFGSAVRRTDVKEAEGIKEALSEAVSCLDGDSSGYRQAVMLCICASESDDSSEARMLLSEASDIALGAVKAMGRRYSESLTLPCTAVFALGIILPMVMVSILPIMGVGGLFGSTPISESAVAATVILLVPSVIMGVSWLIRRSNPFLGDRPFLDGARSVLSLSASLPAFAVLSAGGADFEIAFPVAVAVGCVVCAMLSAADRRESARAGRVASGLRDSVFDLGNALLRGDNFETAAVESVSSRSECEDVALSLSREMDVARGDVAAAVDRAVMPISPDVSRVLKDVYRCSLADADEAGRLAVSMGRQFQSADAVRRELEIRLKSLKDMMTGTAVFFAPAILGMSVSMLAPLGELSGAVDASGMGPLIEVYLLELCAMISVLTSGLGEGDGLSDVAWRFSCTAPVSLIAYLACSSLRLFRPCILSCPAR